MSARAALRTAVVLYWFVAIATITCSFALQGLLPITLQEYLDFQGELEITVGEVVLYIAFFITMLGYLLASLGLMLLQHWGARLFLGLTVLDCLLSCYDGPVVEHAVTAVAGSAAFMMQGAILALAFFTDALKKKSQTDEAAGPEREQAQPA